MTLSSKNNVSGKIDCCFLIVDNAKRSYQTLSDKYSAIEPPTWSLLLAQSMRNFGFDVSIISTLLNIPLPGTLTFSGQLSLSGSILPVGGVSQKLLAGSHLGIRYLIASKMEAALQPSDKYSTELIAMNTVDDVMKLLIKWYL